MSILREILRSSWAYRWFYFWSIVCLLLTNIVAAIIPMAVKEAVDQGSNQGDLLRQLYYPGIIALLALGQFIFRTISRILVYRACREQEHDLRHRLMEAILRIPNWRLKNLGRGDLVTNMVEDTTQVRIFLGFGTVQLFNILLVYAVSIPLMLSISPKLTLLSVFPYPILLIYIAYLNQKLYYKNLDVKEKLGEVTEFVTQTVFGIHVAKSFHAFDGLKSRFQKFNLSHYQSAWSVNILDTMLLPGLIFIASFGEYLVLRYGSEMIYNGQLTNGEFIAFHGYIAYILFASISVGFGMSTFNRGFTSFTRLQDRYDEEIENFDPNVDKVYASELKVEGLRFKYNPNDAFELRIDRLTVKPGEMIGVCGAIGSGKSTFFHTLLALQDFNHGKIRYGSIGLNKETNAYLWRMIFNPVFQEIFLFSKTLRENLCFHRSIEEADLNRALDFAALTEDVKSFKSGLETLVGEKGVRLSQGQKQRVSIARAYLDPAPVWILDDCFSALDTVTEERILQNLLQEKRNRTVFLCSHRGSTLKHCDKILVFEQGVLTEQGTHKELMESEGFYSRMIKLQRKFGAAV